LVNRIEEAAAELDRAIKLNPNHVDAMINLGAARSWGGHLGEAEELFRRAIEADPNNGRAWRQLLWLAPCEKDDGSVEKMEALSTNPNLSATHKIEFQFALGKAYADSGDFDRSFEHFAAGNRLNHDLLGYDVSAHEDAMDQIVDAYSEEYFADRAARSQVSDNTAIFIVGMPRSGTSMVEQILSSHSQVSGVGELSVMSELVMERGRALNTDYPDCMTGLDDLQISEFGQKYIDELQARRPGADRVIDKQTGNFLYAGLICQALPNAKIIHCSRNPLDTCVSCFTLLFGQGQAFSYDLGDLGRFYRAYRNLMDHFHRIAPEQILEVNYENMIAQQEQETRRLLEFLDLPWEYQCLSFHETERAVQTASAGQVRKPIYKSSVARWKRYQDHLAPLKAALGPLADAD